MTNSKTLALAAALTLTTLGSAALAGEGSPDLSYSGPAVNRSDPSGSNYGSRFSEPYYTVPREAYSRAYAPSQSENTGAIIRRNQYEEENGIDGE